MTVVVAFFGASILAWGQLSSDRRKDTPDTLGAVLPSGQPFVKGEEVTLSEAEARVSYPILRPDDALASDESLATVWVEVVPLKDEEVAVSEQVALKYSSGVDVYLDSGATDTAEILATYTAIVSENGGAWTIGEVQGVPALMNPPDSSGDVYLANPGSVQFVLDGVQVTVYGDQPLEELLRVANSVR